MPTVQSDHPVNPPGKKGKVDKKELTERTEAAQRYTLENDNHLVDFLTECVRTSVTSMRDIRAMQFECWRVFQEEEPDNFNDKEVWQTKVTYPKPFKTVQSAGAVIRKIFEMEFLSATNKLNQQAANDWKDLLLTVLGRNYANFPVGFADATMMALAIGQSLEIIPYWDPEKMLQLSLTHPGRIHRDPDALSRHPQSGEWWVHQEYIAYHRLKAMAGEGKRYRDLPDPASFSNMELDPDATEEQIAWRKNMLFAKSRFHKGILTYEFWGTVVAPNGDILLDNGTYTMAGNKIIGLPKPSHYPSLRWPGTGYSALPNMTRWDGRGVIQGIRSLWYLMCNLISLHADHLNWTVNPMIEMDIYSLVDQDNINIAPGKLYQTHGTVQGQQVVRPIDIKAAVGDIMAILNFYDQRHQDGGLMDYATMGLPNFRDVVTATETAQNLDQSMILVASMAKNVEDGALSAIMAAAETVMVNMTYDNLKSIMGSEFADRYRVRDSEKTEYPLGIKLPPLGTGTMHINGITGLMKEQETLANLFKILPLIDNELFQPYFDAHKILELIERLMHLQDAKILIADADKIKAIADRQQKQQEDAIEHKAGTEAATRAGAEAEAVKHGAQAEEFTTESDKNVEQGGLFKAQAAAAAGGAPGAGAQPPETGV